jgi:very-short-patch-repair endonuclease
MGLQLLKERARHIRRTNAQHRLAELLGSKPLRGYRFKREHSIGPFLIDFICIEEALIIELTGQQPALAARADDERRGFLESLGYTVLRLWDSEVLSDPKSALRKVRAALQRR